MKTLIKELNEEYKLDNQAIFMLIILIFTIGGIFGFIYETIFYRIDLGYFVKRGTTFGPWIPIYGIGSILITSSVFKYKKNPILVLLISSLVCGVLEYITGYLLYTIDGIRLWDYNTEILNYGNIGGFICLRSVLFFGLSGLFLIYYIIPWLEKLTKKISYNSYAIISYSLGILFITDCIVSDIIMKFMTLK